MKKCIHCDEPLEDNAKFCPECRGEQSERRKESGKTIAVNSDYAGQTMTLEEAIAKEGIMGDPELDEIYGKFMAIPLRAIANTKGLYAPLSGSENVEEE